MYAFDNVTGEEISLYNSSGDPYGDGVFTIDLIPEVLMTSLIITRPTGELLVICEVQILTGNLCFALNTSFIKTVVCFSRFQ